MRKIPWTKSFLVALLMVSSMGISNITGATMRKLPAFTLYTLQGEEEQVPSSSWSVLYFFSPDCFTCVNTVLQFQNEIQEDKTLLFFPICAECDWRTLRNFKESLPPETKVYFLAPRDRAILGIWNTPTFFLLSPNGKVVQRWDKNVNYQEIARTLATLTGKRLTVRKAAKPSCTGSICE